MDSSRYAELFLTEARDHLTAINQALIELEQSPQSAEPLDAIFRAVHTVKGMSGVMGYSAIGALSHAMESLLTRVRAGEDVLDGDQMTLLFDAADALEQAVEQTATSPASALDVGALVARLDEQRTAGRAARVGRDALPNAPPDARVNDTRAEDTPGGGAATLAPGSVRGTAWSIDVMLEPGTLLPGARAGVVLARARSLGTVSEIAPPESHWLADTFDGRVTLRLVTAVSAAEIARTLRLAGFVHEVRVEAAEPVGGASPDAAWGADAVKAPLQRYVRIDLRRLDHLMNLVGELTIVRGRLADLAARRGDAELEESVAEASRLIGEVQDGVLGGRMVPVWQVFDRFPRVVRDAARALGKEVEFSVEGREIELDRALLEQIADPLVHLLRNCVDHGIESPEARSAVGKRAAGRLTLSATRERSAVVIRVRDDGRGVDRARVLDKARAQGLVDAERDSLTDDEILRLIARPGFSTAERVTELSGRGVGIDAVVSRVRALGGVVELRSAPGEGTTFALRLPVTLSMIPALMAQVADERYALPLTHVTETLQLSRGHARTVRGREVVVLNGEVLPLLHLRAVVGLADASSRDGTIVVVEMAGRRAALVVDRMLGQQEVVVKPFDAVRGALGCFNGATIMSDGSAALILEVSSLL